MTVAIDRAGSDVDFRQICELAREIWNHHYPGIISQDQIDYMLAHGYTPAVLRREVDRESVQYDCARVGGSWVGFGAHGPAEVNANELKLHKLYVLAAHRGTGCARALTDRAFSRAADEGFESLVLQVNKQNAGAIQAYRRIGFEVREEVVVDIGSGFVMDDYVMAARCERAV